MRLCCEVFFVPLQPQSEERLGGEDGLMAKEIVNIVKLPVW